MTDIERVKEVVNWIIFEKIAKTRKEIAQMIGYTESSFSQIINSKVPLSDSFVKNLSNIDHRINVNWLFTGEGEMLNQEKLEPNAILIENPNFIMVSVVGQYAAAGYLAGFADEAYIEELPKVPFFIDHEVKGNYMGFEVRGDSMDDNSVNSIIEGDTLICRQIKPDLWHNKLHIQKWYFVIVHKEEGIIVKQIVDHNPETGDITIHSLNSFYPDRVLNLRDVAQLFNVVQINRKPRL